MNTKTELFEDWHTGRLACMNHVGHHARLAITADPEADKWETAATAWVRFTEFDAPWWIKVTNELPCCETCYEGR